jgi:LPPG:FO 2-phospho-L-lactate transferase
LPALGVEVSAVGVGEFYGARQADGILDGWLIHSSDSAKIEGVTVLARDLLMSSESITAEMVADAAAMVFQ